MPRKAKTVSKLNTKNPLSQVPSANPTPILFAHEGLYNLNFDGNEINALSAELGIGPASKGGGFPSSKSQEPQTPPEAMALSESSKRKASDKPSKPDKKKDKTIYDGIPGALPPKAVITTKAKPIKAKTIKAKTIKAKTIKAKTIYEGFPKKLIDAGYNQGLLDSIKKSSIIKNQAEFTEKLSYLNDHIDALINLVKNSRIDFKAEEITSILHGSGQNVGNAIKALAEGADNLKTLVDLGFSPTNISSILSESGQNVGLAIDALTSNERVDKLKKLLAPVENEGIGFNPKNISGILNGSGQNVGLAIDALTNGYEALKKLLAPVEEGGAGFTPVNISGILHGSGQNVGKEIDALEIINVANQGRSNPISTEILRKFLAKLPKKDLIDINYSNVESILSESEKTKLRDPSSQVPSSGAQSSNDPSSQASFTSAPSSFEPYTPFGGFGFYDDDADEEVNTEEAAELSKGLGIGGPSTTSQEEGPSSSKSQEGQIPKGKMNPSRGSKRPSDENLAGSAKKR